MAVLFIVLFALLGVALGSFLNVCLDRLPRNESVVNPPSRCEVCQHPLVAKDIIPIFSYLWLRGRCGYCRSAIPRRLFWVELATGIMFAFLYWWCVVLNPELGIVALGVMAFYACLFILVFVVDLEHGLILNKVVYPGMAIALLLALFVPQPWLTTTPWISQGIASAAIGGGIGLAIFLLLAIASRGGMGWGDVKLAALIGLATGFPLVFVSLIMAAILGGLVAVVLVASKKKKRQDAVPFGPFLAVTAMATVIWGSSILSWYVGL